MNPPGAGFLRCSELGNYICRRLQRSYTEEELRIQTRTCGPGFACIVEANLPGLLEGRYRGRPASTQLQAEKNACEEVLRDLPAGALKPSGRNKISATGTFRSTTPPRSHACSSAAASTVGASAEPSIRTASDAATSYTPTNSVTPTTTPRAANPREENDGGPVPSLRTAWDSAAFSTPTTGATSSATPWAANAPLEENNAGPVPSIRTAWDSAAFSTPTTEATSSATPWAANAPLEENNAGPVPSIRTAWDSAAFSTPTTKATSTATPWAANPPQEQNLQQEQEPATGYTNWTGPAPAGDTGPTDAPGAYSYNAFQTQRCGCSLEDLLQMLPASALGDVDTEQLADILHKHQAQRLVLLSGHSLRVACSDGWLSNWDLPTSPIQSEDLRELASKLSLPSLQDDASCVLPELGLHRASVQHGEDGQIKSMVIHITRLLPGICDMFQEQMSRGSVIFLGPLCSGKTTILRDIAARLSATCQVAVADFTGEFQYVRFAAQCVRSQPGEEPSQLICRVLAAQCPEVIIAEFDAHPGSIFASAKMCADAGVRLVCSARATLDVLMEHYLQASLGCHVPSCCHFPLNAIVLLRRELDYVEIYREAGAAACSMTEGWRTWCPWHQGQDAKVPWPVYLWVRPLAPAEDILQADREADRTTSV